MSQRLQILLVGLITEGILAASWYFGYHFELILPKNFTYHLLQYLALTIFFLCPLLLLNYLLFLKFPNQSRKQFLETRVLPLCQLLKFPDALIISCLAGLGEELFFRDLLLNYFANNLGFLFGLALSSLAFATMHFIGSIKGNLSIIAIYTIVGCYLGGVYLVTESILICIMVHASYDLIAIITYRKTLGRLTN